MPAAFAPLALPTSKRAEAGTTFHLKVIPQAQSTPAFKPFQPAPAPSPAAHPTHAHQPPKVTLQREGDRVTHIRLECACGEVFELACEY
ncbi:MAG: hypothetical protein RL514_1601 [Verrucomicrobiota bacterium]|jgi:hypothetical protein